MKLITLVKHVPDSRANVAPRPDGRGVDESSLRMVCDPFDEFGVEQAVRLAEARSDVESITAIAAGPASSAEALRHALSMGATHALHIVGDILAARDDMLVARAIAAAIRARAIPFDLILCGKQNIDTDAGALGPALAELLEVPHVGAAVALNLAADGLTCTARRRIEGGEELVELCLPALITCEKGLVEPRHPALPKIMKAKKHPIETIAASELAIEPAAGSLIFDRLLPPPARPACQLIDGSIEDMARELVRRLREEAKVV
jgi:electron transfer flavoprotein beta subunit